MDPRLMPTSTTMAKLSGLLGVMVAVLLFASTVHAGIPQEATELMIQGAEEYEEGNYHGASEVFREAFEVHPDARFMFNAARASERGGSMDDAARFYRKALDVDGEDRRLDADDQATASGFVNAHEQEGTARQIAADIAASPTDEQPEDVEPAGWSLQRTLGVGGMAAGAVLSLGAAAAGWHASSGINELETDGVDSPKHYEDRVASIERSQRLGQWSLYAGAALVVTGAALVGWEMLGGDDLQAGTPGVSVGTDGFAVRWEVRFD